LQQSLEAITDLAAALKANVFPRPVRSIIAGAHAAAGASADWDGACWASYVVHFSKFLLECAQKRVAVCDLLCPGLMNAKHSSPHALKALNKLNKALSAFMDRVAEDVEDFGRASTTLVLGSSHHRDILDKETAQVVHSIKEWGQHKSRTLQARAEAKAAGQDPSSVLDTHPPSPYDPAPEVLYSFVPHPRPQRLHYLDHLPLAARAALDQPFAPFKHVVDSAGRPPVTSYDEADLSDMHGAGASGGSRKTTPQPSPRAAPEEKKDGLFGGLTNMFSKKDEKREVVSHDLHSSWRPEATPHPGLSYCPGTYRVPASVTQLFDPKPLPAMPQPPKPLGGAPAANAQGVVDKAAQEAYAAQEQLIADYPWLLEQWKRELDREEAVVPAHVVRGAELRAGKMTVVRDTHDDVFFDQEDLITGKRQTRARRLLTKDQRKHERLLAGMWGAAAPATRLSVTTHAEGAAEPADDDEEAALIAHHVDVVSRMEVQDVSKLQRVERAMAPFVPAAARAAAQGGFAGLAATYPQPAPEPKKKAKARVRGKGKKGKKSKTAAAAAEQSQEKDTGVFGSIGGLFGRSTPSPAPSPKASKPKEKPVPDAKPGRPEKPKKQKDATPPAWEPAPAPAPAPSPSPTAPAAAPKAQPKPEPAPAPRVPHPESPRERTGTTCRRCCRRHRFPSRICGLFRREQLRGSRPVQQLRRRAVR
jgi:hypothetical protein